ncbi:MAG: S8 family serine peptidase [Steroidobacteraceae bacterium]|jgi:serine protease
MRAVIFILVVLALGAGPAQAAAAERNSVRTHPVDIGPQTHRLIVGFRAPAGAADVAALAARHGLAFAKSRQFAAKLHVLFLQKTLYGADVLTALATLRTDPAVSLAAVDQRRYALDVPNDPLFQPSSTASGQWYMLTPNPNATVQGVSTMDLAATDVVSAWNITTGSTGTVIADVDTGVRFDHPDLLRAGLGGGGRLLPGYDFVGEDYNSTTGAALGTYLSANDGDGWDPDPSDPGDWIDSADQQNTAVFPAADCPSANSSWHGTRVMGVLGAITNNDAGIAGMTWGTWLLPVRALGKCAGYDSDILAGMQWAAGIAVAGVPDNPHPANIINLSLGGTGTCTDANDPYPGVIASILAKGVLIVASAGNGGNPGSLAPVDEPADCAGVLAVAGLRNVGTKVGYSSFGAQVGVSAPAGNCINSSGACLRSIDTTFNLGATVPGANSYTDDTNTNLGTSFSAPIVSGIAALMRAVNANLTPAQLIARIESSATAFPPGAAGVPTCPTTDPTSGECACVAGQCGAGMVNALNAVMAAQQPIVLVSLPAAVSSGTGAVFDAGGSTPQCGGGALSFAWSAAGGGITFGSATNASKVTVIPGTSQGTVTLRVTDSLGATGIAVITVTSTSATTSPTNTTGAAAATAATACPTAVSVAPTPPTVSQSFSPASVGENTVSTLTITLANANGFDLTQSNFSGTLPGGLTIAASPMATTSCAGTGSNATYTTTGYALSDFIIPANRSCSVILPVESAAAGTYASTFAAGALTTAPAGGNGAASSAALTVTAPSKGGGALGWPELLFAAGLLAAGRRRVRLH